MNTQSDALRESPLESQAIAVISPGRRIYWSGANANCGRTAHSISRPSLSLRSSSSDI